MSDLKVGPNARFTVKWKTTPYDFSKDKENDIKSKFSKKYGIDKMHVKIVPEFIMLSETGDELDVAKDVISNIQDPAFQIKLFKEYLDLNGIEGYDFDLITKIDSELNQQIDYNVYDKYRRFSIKWVKWDNFLSYGSGNSLDFTKLKGLTLLNGHNQAGKTTVSNDLIHFLLFGTTSKYKTQDKIFNRYLPKETNVNVEGCITIDGEDYVIKRILSRPAKRTSKSKVTQKVEYYRIVGDTQEELEEFTEDCNAESTQKTNKVIKEAIGNESDFDLMVSINDSNLDALVNKKEAERGRLLSRWIGLLPIEEKDKIAREHFNQTVKPYLLSNQYSSEALTNEIGSFKTMIQEVCKQNDKLEKDNQSLDVDIETIEKAREALLASKTTIDESLMKIDITTLKTSMNRVKEEGKRKATEVESIVDELKSIGDVEFSVETYDKLVEELTKLNIDKGRLGAEYKQLKHDIEHLKKSEFCPTCGKKLDNVDNTKQITEKEYKLSEVETEGKSISSRIKELEEMVSKMKENRDKYDRKNKISTQKIALDLNIEKLRNEWKELNQKLKDYQKNSEAIDKNNNIDIQIRNSEYTLRDKRSTKESNIRRIAEGKTNVEKYRSEITKRDEIIKQISEEEKLIRAWKIYLDMIGKNGISKMVLRRALPIINARLKELLSDVCDFDVEIGINDKNDVMFYVVKDGLVDELNGGSGFELTAASLALRFVLGSVSTIPRLNYVTLDEVWGRVEVANFENIKALLEKMLKDYDFLLLVSHQEEIKNWCEKSLVAEKNNNVSTIRIASQREK